MFKIEVVADTPEAMASKLAALSEIYREGARLVKNHDGIVESPANDNTPSEAPKRRGRAKVKASEEVSSNGEDRTAVETGTPEPLTIDDVRKAMKDYIDAAAVQSGKEETRRTEFKALLEHFNVPKLGELPEDKWPAMVELARSKSEALGEDS